MLTSEQTILDCGHAPSIDKTGFGTGYGKYPDGRTICYACCAERDRESMRKHGDATLYLVRRDTGWFVANWPGSLEFRAYGVTTSKHGGGFGCQRTDAWFNFDGFVWHAINRGNMDIARCRRTKQRTAQAANVAQDNCPLCGQHRYGKPCGCNPLAVPSYVAQAAQEG